MSYVEIPPGLSDIHRAAGSANAWRANTLSRTGSPNFPVRLIQLQAAILESGLLFFKGSRVQGASEGC